MTAADRPSVTDNARADSAWIEWAQNLTGAYVTTTEEARQQIEGLVSGLMELTGLAPGAAARAETTTATVEDAARLLRDEWMHSGPEVTWLHMARALDAHGLLATARTRPTREQIIDVLVMSPLSDTAGTDMRPFEQTADAVLALLNEETDRG